MKAFKIFLAILLIIAGLICPTICIVKGVQFDQNCKGYLQQAADANSPELALDRLNKAIEYIEDHNLTSGYTSMFYKTEDENIGFWYKNIIECREDIKDCLQSSQLEKTNVLMKVRESLTDTGVTVPLGIYLYPYNRMWCLARWASYLMIIIGVIGIIAECED